VFKFPSEFTPRHDAEIIGVVEDFQIGSVTEAIPNAVFYVQRDPDISRQIVLRLTSNNLPDALEQVDRVWDEAGSSGPISRHFLDQGIDNMYRSISRQSQLLSIYAGIAIFIAILGLFGLAAFVTEKRTKEIGIRKVLGGTRLDIIRLLLWQFSIPVFISNLIAWPVAFYYLTNWLQGFQTHIDLSLWIFILAGAMTLLIAVTTVFSHAFLVASKNPVQALRYE
jgi:putative ABC transport system permease protein